jgi:phytanoyl-CoA hydroxylase
MTLTNWFLTSYFTHFRSSGILKQGTSPREGIYNPSGNPTDHTGIGAPVLSENDFLRDRIVTAHVTESYLSFLQHPALRSFVRSFMQWKEDVLLPRSLLRHTVPGSESTGVHYDQIFLRGGDPHDEFLTAWVPIGDIAVNGGGLIYLEDSSSLGRSIEDDFTALAKKTLLTPEQTISAFNVNMMAGGTLSRDAQEFATTHASGKKWLTAKYDAGDIVFHNPYILHAAAMNEDLEGKIRLSTDLRFYEEGARLDSRWMKAFTIGDGL